ncbi:F-box/kelch-repeat protein At3g06240-like [Rhododendron vialii]|uniref:F-box/kelch-repeat protein At3g06240-like n=1 Tax=Rhododendron vialii TaxID=182163 RepID=UPI00265E401D|nr:F-box/kelch-repeat protein At3g06240-like [Rhododendron vialii]
MSSDGTLPREVLTDVLSRLPVKSLCRFKCVSPSWNSLISDPYFAKTHLNRTNTLKNPKHLYPNKIIMSTYHSLYSVDFTNLNPTITKLDFPTMAQHAAAAVRSSCDGLLLASNNDRSVLFLLNPSTRECNKFPPPPSVLDPVHKICGSHYGLGYDSSTDNYKVVIISRYNTRFFQYNTEFSHSFTLLDVYSLATNAWRRITGIDYRPMGNSGGVFFKGCIHGLCLRACSQVIFAFDLSDEVFREVPLPASFSGCKISLYDVAVFGGSLCLVSRQETKVWMMKEYGVRESWTEFTVSSGLRTANLLCLLAEDEFLLRTTKEKLKQLVVYNQKKGMARDMVVCSIPPRFSFEGTYVESLISPHHGRGNGRQ